MYHFLMPADGLDPSTIESHFRDQATALREVGNTTSIVGDRVFKGSEQLRRIPGDRTIIYRGWMVTPSAYRRFEEAVRDAGASLLVSSEAYKLTHHLPEWYPLLKEFTPETVWITNAVDLTRTLSELNWGSYFLKDFVKSLKVGGGSVIHTLTECDRWVNEYLYYRDEFEGGICIRRLEHFVAESERRFFVLNGRAYGPEKEEIPLPVKVATIRVNSPFFTVDVALSTSGDWRIVELGDGQVSDLVGWTANRFAEIWR